MDLPEIRTVAEAIFKDVRYSCVYLGGSRAVGWHHASSDVDLFAISESEPPPATGQNLDVTVSGPAPSIVISYHNGVRFDVEYWTTRQLGELADRLREPSSRETLSHADMDILWRLRTGHLLLGDHRWFNEQKLSVTEEDLRYELARRGVYSAEVRLDDAAGLLTANEPFMAALAAREAFARVIDALLSHSGSPVPPSKWRFRRLREAEGFEDIFNEYLAVETMSSFEPTNPSEWVRSVVLRSRQLLREIDV